MEVVEMKNLETFQINDGWVFLLFICSMETFAQFLLHFGGMPRCSRNYTIATREKNFFFQLQNEVRFIFAGL